MLFSFNVAFPLPLCLFSLPSRAERHFLESEHPQTYKFAMKGPRLMIHATRWHDLGQYYCVVAGEVKAIYLLYQRPIILFAAPAKKLDKHNLLTPETIEEPSDFANRLNQLSEGFRGCCSSFSWSSSSLFPLYFVKPRCSSSMRIAQN